MTNRLRTALVALLVIVGFALPASAAPSDARPEAGFSLRVAKLMDTILDSLATVLPSGEAAIAKSDTNSDGTSALPRDGGLNRMAFDLEPNG